MTKSDVSDFFESQSERSRIKSEIVKGYWSFYLTFMASKIKSGSVGGIGFFDLFCGKGVYDDGSESTPIKVIKSVIEKGIDKKKLVMVFADAEEDVVSEFERNVDRIENVESIRESIHIIHHRTGKSMVDWIRGVKLPPTFFFIDPFGYKGISLDLILAATESFGCDCIFFFNYNRINMSIKNKSLLIPVNEFLGEDLAESLRERIERACNPHERRSIILEAIFSVLRDNKRYVFPFTFSFESERKISHDIMLVTKHPIGVGAFKDVASKFGFMSEDEIPTYEFCDADRSLFPLLSEFSKTLDDLKGHLLRKYAGKRLTIKEIFEDDQQYGPFVRKNYKRAVIELEQHGAIKCIPAIGTKGRPSRNGVPTAGDGVVVTFP